MFCIKQFETESSCCFSSNAYVLLLASFCSFVFQHSLFFLKYGNNACSPKCLGSLSISNVCIAVTAWATKSLVQLVLLLCVIRYRTIFRIGLLDQCNSSSDGVWGSVVSPPQRGLGSALRPPNGFGT